jgi:hypothetical protein
VYFHDRGQWGGIVYEEFADLCEYLYATALDLQPKRRQVVEGAWTVMSPPRDARCTFCAP